MRERKLLEVKRNGQLPQMIDMRQIPKHELRRNPIEDGAISGFSGQKSVPE